ncbi:MAG: hypothetical protein KatS3mg014_1298 [Actinomycetota bacterium]|nr:MAG: hypothetical protein KatS3mg014_1298 [Actinomycetota bacterium]
MSETVGLVSARRRGLVNAVLRRLAASPPEAPAGEGDEAISARSGLAPWAVAELRALLPSEEVEAAALALAAPARVGLRANRCRASPEAVEEALRAAGVGVERSPLHPDCLLLEHGAPAELPGFAEGWFAVQDPASVLVVAALDPRAGERVLDACAGPGGKTGHVACLVGPAGLVVAADVAPSRARLVVRTCERLGVRAAVLVQDGRRPALRAGFDRALVDAPCSGLGAARRRPELLWRAEPAELPRLADLQVGILAATAELLRPRGTAGLLGLHVPPGRDGRRVRRAPRAAAGARAGARSRAGRLRRAGPAVAPPPRLRRDVHRRLPEGGGSPEVG